MFGSTLAAGALAGFLATGPMTLAMEVMHRFLPWRERYPLPPSQITANLTAKIGVRDQMDRGQHVALTLLNHFAYGAGVGALYAPMANKVPMPPAVKGIGYGLLVWLVSYLGLLPAVGLLRPATQQPEGRNVLMIAAHVVWGAVAGILTERFQGRR